MLLHQSGDKTFLFLNRNRRIKNHRQFFGHLIFHINFIVDNFPCDALLQFGCKILPKKQIDKLILFNKTAAKNIRIETYRNYPVRRVTSSRATPSPIPPWPVPICIRAPFCSASPSPPDLGRCTHYCCCCCCSDSARISCQFCRAPLCTFPLDGRPAAVPRYFYRAWPACNHIEWQ